MNRELAESYVLYGINSTNFTKKTLTHFLLINIILFAFSAVTVAFSREISFVILVIVSIILNIVITCYCHSKWSAVTYLITQATQILFFIIAINYIYFGYCKTSGFFVWYEYAVSIVTQFAAFALSVPITVHLAKKHNIEKKPLEYVKKSSIHLLIIPLSSILYKIFLTDAPFSVVLTILCILLNLVALLSSSHITATYYRAYLIKKFNLTIDLKQLP